MTAIYKQRATYDCLLACIATAVQKPYEELWPDDFCRLVEDEKGTHGDNVDRAFEIAGLRKNTDYWCVYLLNEYAVNPNVKQLLNGRRAILQVPSLNYQGTYHLIYWNGETLYDPSNKQIYQWINQCVPVYVWIFDERSKP